MVGEVGCAKMHYIIYGQLWLENFTLLTEQCVENYLVPSNATYTVFYMKTPVEYLLLTTIIFDVAELPSFAWVQRVAPGPGFITESLFRISAKCTSLFDCVIHKIFWVIMAMSVGC